MNVGGIEIDDKIIDRACVDFNIKKENIVVDEETIKRLDLNLIKVLFDNKKIPLVSEDDDGSQYRFMRLQVTRGERVPLFIRVFYKE